MPYCPVCDEEYDDDNSSQPCCECGSSGSFNSREDFLEYNNSFENGNIQSAEEWAEAWRETEPPNYESYYERRIGKYLMNDEIEFPPHTIKSATKTKIVSLILEHEYDKFHARIAYFILENGIVKKYGGEHINFMLKFLIGTNESNINKLQQAIINTEIICIIGNSDESSKDDVFLFPYGFCEIGEKKETDELW